MFEIFKLFNRDPLGTITPEQLKEVLQSIETKYNALQEENRDLGAKLRDSLTQIAHLEEEKNEQKTQLAVFASLEIEKKSLESRVQELEEKITNDQTSDLQSRLEALEEERNQLLQRIPEQEALLAAIDDQGRALEERLLELAKTVEALEQQEAIPDPALLQTIEEQRGRILVFEEEMTALAQKMQAFDNQADQSAELARLEEENTRLKAEVEESIASQKKTRGKTGRLQSLETEKLLLEEHVRELERRMPDFDSLSARLAEKEGVLQALQESQLELQDRLEQLSLENERLASESMRLEAALSDAEGRSEADRTLIQELEGEVGRLMAGDSMERRVPKPPAKPAPKPPQPAAAPADRAERRAMLAKMLRG